MSYAPQTPSGLHNMLGNVWEWVVAVKSTKSSPMDSKQSKGKKRKEKRKREEKDKEKDSDQRILRGGSFIDS